MTKQEFINSAKLMTNSAFTELSGSDQHESDGICIIAFADFMGVSFTAEGKYFLVIGNESWQTDKIEDLYSVLYDGYDHLTGEGTD